MCIFPLVHLCTNFKGGKLKQTGKKETLELKETFLWQSEPEGGLWSWTAWVQTPAILGIRWVTLNKLFNPHNSIYSSVKWTS